MRPGVPECEAPGVQRLTVEVDPLIAPAVDGITDNRMPEGLQVNANLVRASGFEAEDQFARAVQPFPNLIVRHRRLTIRANRVALTVALVAADRSFDGTAFAFRNAVNQAEVGALDE